MKTAQLFIALTLTLLLAGCAPQTHQMPDGSQMANENVKEFSIEAFQFGYAPSEIRVKSGDHVRIHLHTRDVGHSLAITTLDLNIPAYPGKDGEAEFTAPEPGTYPWRCRIPCGHGHDAMRGTLVVE